MWKKLRMMFHTKTESKAIDKRPSRRMSLNVAGVRERLMRAFTERDTVSGVEAAFLSVGRSATVSGAAALHEVHATICSECGAPHLLLPFLRGALDPARVNRLSLSVLREVVFEFLIPVAAQTPLHRVELEKIARDVANTMLQRIQMGTELPAAVAAARAYEADIRRFVGVV